MAEVVGALLVPCSPDSQAALESLLEGVRDAFREVPHAAEALGAAAWEAGPCILTQQPVPGVSSVVSCTVYREEGLPVVEFTHPGEGLVVNGARAPYPPYVVGLTFLLARAMGLKLYARVETRDAAQLFLREPGLQVSPPTPGGPMTEKDRDFRRLLALMSVCRYWRSVRFSRPSGGLSILRLEHPIRAVGVS